jgi:DNA-binding XRE family transcriptional regulator
MCSPEYYTLFDHVKCCDLDAIGLTACHRNPTSSILCNDTNSPWIYGHHPWYFWRMLNDERLLKSFGERVRSLRHSLGFSQEALADACGLDRTYVGGIERGERNPSLRNIARLAVALNVTLDELMQGVTSNDP